MCGIVFEVKVWLRSAVVVVDIACGVDERGHFPMSAIVFEYFESLGSIIVVVDISFPQNDVPI
jgi:hypothetical protein